MNESGPPFWFAEAAPMPGLARLTVRSDCGALLALRMAGQGPPLLLLPGLMDPWHSFAPAAAELARFTRPSFLDWRGHGGSAAAAPGQYSVVAYARDAEAVLRAVAEPAFVAGNSLGALVALRLAVTAPELVRGILLEDGPFFFTEAPGWAGHWLQSARFRPLRDLLRAREAQGLDFEAFANLHAALPFPLAPELDAPARAAWLATLAQRLEPVVAAMPETERGAWQARPPARAAPRWADVLPPPVHRRLATQDYRTATGVLETACGNGFSAGFDHAGALAALTRPMRALLADPAVSRTVPAWVGDRLHGFGPVETVPGAGHQIHRDAPAAFVAAIRALIKAAA